MSTRLKCTFNEMFKLEKRIYSHFFISVNKIVIHWIIVREGI